MVDYLGYNLMFDKIDWRKHVYQTETAINIPSSRSFPMVEGVALIIQSKIEKEEAKALSRDSVITMSLRWS